MFQLCLSDKLREHLAKVAAQGADGEQQPFLYDASRMRMMQIPDYAASNAADNVKIFHGREVRNAADAAGGQGCVLHLSMAGEEAGDPEGWTQGEMQDYDGWGHDSSRPWRKGRQLESEGFKGYVAKFGPEAYGLHHRFYLHLDGKGAMWLAAEDGCEGEPWGPSAM